MTRWYKHIAIIVIFTFGASYTINAQSITDARLSFSKGQYRTAVLYYDTIIEEYRDNGQSTYSIEQERGKAITCRDYLLEVDRLKKNNRYSDAIVKLRQILSINPSDPNIKAKIRECESLKEHYIAQKGIDEDWNKCRILADYYVFRQTHPGSKYDAQAASKIQELEEIVDDEQWRDAKSRNSIQSYQSYLNKAASYSKHVYEAQQKLYSLLISQASNYYNKHDYDSAKSVYEKARMLDALTEASARNYNKCCEEVDYKALSKAPYKHKIDIQNFMSKYPNSEHINLVRGWLVEKEMALGNFDEARKIVENYTAAYSESLTPDEKWWKKHIKAKERDYKKNHNSKTISSASNRSRPRQTVNDDPLLLRLPLSLGLGTVSNEYCYMMGERPSKNALAKLGAGIGVGDYNNLFNFDVLAAVWGNGDVKSAFLISAAPSINLLRYNDYDYHMNIQPFYGWHNIVGNIFGIRAGIGWEFSDISLGVSYGVNTRLMADISFRINIHLLGF